MRVADRWRAGGKRGDERGGIDALAVLMAATFLLVWVVAVAFATGLTRWV